EPSGGANRSQRSEGARGYVGQLRRAVAADAVAALEVGHDLRLLGHDGKPGRKAYAPAHPRVVERTGERGRASVASRRKVGNDDRLRAAGIHAVAERADDSDHFVVAPSRIVSGLEQEVGRPVGGISAGVHKVVETSASARNVDEEVVV